MAEEAKFVLIPHQSGANLYIRELARAYERLGWRVVLGRENFLYHDCKPAIVHVHWPEQLYRIGYESGSDVDKAEYALRRLGYFISRGAKCVLTMHNLKPHEKADTTASQIVCNGVYERAGVIVHHCEKSIDLAIQVYGDAAGKKHIVCPHGHYFGYKNDIGRNEARKKLGLSEDAFVYLYFGLIRSYKGLGLLLRAFRAARVKRKHLVIAGQVMGRLKPRARWVLRWMRVWRRFGGNISLHLRPIPNDEVQVFMNACDAVVLAHTSGLNSGVVVLGMTFGRIVVGPDIGCIGAVLGSGLNVRFDPDGGEKALTRAMQEAVGIDRREAESRNVGVARTWNWDQMASQILGAL